VLPPTAPPDLAVQAVDDPTIHIHEADVEPGKELFGKYCTTCHGFNITSGAVAPDLRESQIALHRENLWNILHDGALLQNGMPRFPELTEAQIGQIYAYVRSRARETLSGLQPPLN
jgi:quinohemoprotein ethanol dehydrogenase